HTHPGWVGKMGELLAPPHVLHRNQGMEQVLEPLQLPRVVEDDGRNRPAIELAVGSNDAVPELLDDRLAYLVPPHKLVDDLGARPRRRAMAGERRQRFALPCPDSAGDRDGDRPAHSSSGMSAAAGSSSASTASVSARSGASSTGPTSSSAASSAS